MNRRLPLACMLFTAALLMGAAVTPYAPAADRLVLLEGQELSAEIASIDEGGQVQGAGIPAGTTLEGLRKIDRAPANSSAEKAAILVELAGGGRIHSGGLSVASEKFTIKWAHGADLVLPIDVIRAVRFKAGAADDGFAAALAKPSADNDRLFVDIDGKPTTLSGLVESIDGQNVSFQYNNAARSLPIDKVYGIVFAALGGATGNKAGITVELSDGSRLAGAVRSLADGQLTLTVGKSTAVTVPWTDVGSLVVRSTRLAFLSDLEPSKVQEQRIVTLPGAWQRDRNVYKQTLRLGERSYDRGIGAHSHSELVFDLDGAYDSFTATIGIDAAADGKGDCVFVVQADGRELLRQRKKGTDAPQEIKLDIAGVKSLSLIVEAGEDLDLADLADWADARVIRQKP
jgi:hypothetical protein